MTKIVVLGDCHMGARSGSSHFVRYFNKFFTEVLYPYMLDNNIREIVQLGDIFDNRTNLHLKAFHMSKPEWFDALDEYGFKMHILLGNHDITMRESLKVNTPESIMGDYIRRGTVRVYNKPETIEIDGTQFDIIPWICTENKEEVKEFMTRKKVGDVCFGHFEISGAQMYRGIEGHGGLGQDLFERYAVTFSGHYHTRSWLPEHRIQYVGTPYEITWMDAHDPRGFTVFDTETMKWDFIRNPFTMFEKIYYRGSPKELGDYRSKFVKLIVEKKDNLYEFDQFLQKLRAQEPYDLAIVENLDELSAGDISDEEFELDDTLSIISKYIDSLETDLSKEKIKSFINGLYLEALNQ